MKEYNRKWRAENPDKVREYARNEYKRKRDQPGYLDKKNEWQREYIKKNREFINYRNKCYRIGIKPISIKEWRSEHQTNV